MKKDDIRTFVVIIIICTLITGLVLFLNRKSNSDKLEVVDEYKYSMKRIVVCKTLFSKSVMVGPSICSYNHYKLNLLNCQFWAVLLLKTVKSYESW